MYGISDDQQSGLPEPPGDLVGQGTGGPTVGGGGNGAGVLGVFDDSPPAIRSGGDALKR